MSKTSKEVCLVVMPYNPIEQPSIALSILKAGLNHAEITATVVYANLLWAEEIGIHVYTSVSINEQYDLIPDWTFSNAAFSNFKPDPDKYYHNIQINLRQVEQLLQRVDKQKNVRDILLNLRMSAPTFIERVAKAILEWQPRIVVCSSMFMEHCSSLALLRRIKELNPNIVTIMTGNNCEASMGVVTHKKCIYVDFVISGDADLVFPQLCQQVLISGTDLSIHQLPEGVLGPAHRSDGYAQCPPRAKIENMNDSHIPDYDDYFTALQASSIGYQIVPGVQIETSRGCWWAEVSHCTFCGFNGDYINYRSKAPNRVVKELEYLSQRYHTKNFIMVDKNLDRQF